MWLQNIRRSLHPISPTCTEIVALDPQHVRKQPYASQNTLQHRITSCTTVRHEQCTLKQIHHHAMYIKLKIEGKRVMIAFKSNTTCYVYFPNFADHLSLRNNDIVYIREKSNTIRKRSCAQIEYQLGVNGLSPIWIRIRFANNLICFMALFYSLSHSISRATPRKCLEIDNHFEKNFFESVSGNVYFFFIY